MRSHIITILVSSLILASPALAKSKAHRGHDATLGVEFVGMKAKGGWTAVVIAIQNQGTADATFECCEAFLENGAGYAVPALTPDEMAVVIHNKAKTAATVGALIGVGLGLGGAISDNKDLVYAGTGVGVASGVGGVLGQASAENAARNLVIDNVMRTKSFPAGLKVAGVVYFPPKKKWPNSNQPRAIHVTYKLRGQQYRVTVPTTS